MDYKIEAKPFVHKLGQKYRKATPRTDLGETVKF